MGCFCSQHQRFFAALIIVVYSTIDQTAFALNQVNQDNAHAAILVYHHVSSNTPPATSVSVEQFESHLNYLSDHHTVVPLGEIVNHLQSGTELKQSAIAITFDDGYRNILDNAHPLLTKYAMPYTVFINPTLIGKQPNQLNWAQIKDMSKQGVIFANHTSDHQHILARATTENDQQWLTRVLADIDVAERLIQQQLGYSLKWLAYPYGEYNLLLKDTLVKQGYIGLGQQSGAVSYNSDFGALPRFPAAGLYANLATLKIKMASLAMPIISAPHEPLRGLHQQPKIVLRLDIRKLKPSQVTCFYNSTPVPLSLTEETVSFVFPKPLKVGRSRVNCTAPSRQQGRFYWYSQAFVVPTQDGVFID